MSRPDTLRRWRRPLLVAGGVAAFAGCLLHLGELGRFPWDAQVLLATLGLAAIAMITLSTPARRLLAGVLALPLAFLFWQVGHASHTRAFTACLDEGDLLRPRLDVFRRQHGHFPAELEELPGPLPCPLITRASLLDYQRSDSGYRLSFGDALVSHVASESEAFAAQK